MDERGKKTILVVDDGESVLELLKYRIEKDGHRVVVAIDGDGAVKIAENSALDLILLDLVLPGKSGIEVLRTLQEGKSASVPVIAISGKFREEFLWQIIRDEPSVRDFFLKPLNLDRLISKINSIFSE